MTVIRPVVLSGGSGTRLWPLSTAAVPKQFAELLVGETLFGQAIRRLAGHSDVVEPLVVTGDRYTELIRKEADRAGVVLGTCIVEPEGRNTAPACIAAALVADPEDVLVILPSDHMVGDESGFRDKVSSAVDHAGSGHIVTFGITPDSPNTGYGYIQMGEPVGDAHKVARFREKPGREEAENLLSAGSHVWNSGMFVVSAGVLIEEATIHCPEVAETVKRSLVEPQEGFLFLTNDFREAPSISFDHAIMERTERALVFPIDVGWDDVGSFEALWSVSDTDDDGNAISGHVLLSDVSGSYVKATSRTVAVAGLEDVIVVETEEAVLVVAKDRSQLVRDLSDRASAD